MLKIWGVPKLASVGLDGGDRGVDSQGYVFAFGLRLSTGNRVTEVKYIPEQNEIPARSLHAFYASFRRFRARNVTKCSRFEFGTTLE
jgi:hypothetical protein